MNLNVICWTPFIKIKDSTSFRSFNLLNFSKMEEAPYQIVHGYRIKIKTNEIFYRKRKPPQNKVNSNENIRHLLIRLVYKIKYILHKKFALVIAIFMFFAAFYHSFYFNLLSRFLANFFPIVRGQFRKNCIWLWKKKANSDKFLLSDLGAWETCLHGGYP